MIIDLKQNQKVNIILKYKIQMIVLIERDQMGHHYNKLLNKGECMIYIQWEV